VRQNSVDNRNVVLPDGGYRQVFSRWRSLIPGPDGLPGQDPYYVTAISSDGVRWTDEGDSPIGYYIPVRLPDGTYRAFGLSRAPATLYTSTDAKNWTVVGHIVPPEAGNPKCGTTSGMFSDVIALSDGTFRAYYNCEVGAYFNIKATAIRSATSKDGLVWLKDPGERINPLDGLEIPRGPDGQVSGAGAADHPRVFTLRDGTLKMFYNSLNLCCLWSATSVDGLTWTNRRSENLWGGDADTILLADGRLRVFVSGNLGLPADFAGHSAGENWSRTVSYIYGPTNYRIAIPDPLHPSSVGTPAHVAIAVDGFGHSVQLAAAAYSGIGGTQLHDLVDGSYGPVRVAFTPPSGKPPFTADAEFTWTIPELDQSSTLAGGVLIVADDGTTKQVVPVRWSWSSAGPNCGPSTGTPCLPTNCGPGTGTPCAPNCGPGTGTPCAPPPASCPSGTVCPPTNCGPGQPRACPSPEVACKPGQPIPSQGCVTTGYDGLPKLCLPKGQDPIAPPVCQLFY